MIRKLSRFTVLLDSGHIEILEHNTISDGDTEYVIGNHRRVLTPGDDVSGEHKQIRDHAAGAWTPELIAQARARGLAGP